VLDYGEGSDTWSANPLCCAAVLATLDEFAARDVLGHVVGPGDDPVHLRLAGGGTTDPAWRQMLADILGHPLNPVTVVDASGLGAALLGARAAGLAGPAPDIPPAGTFVTEPRTGDTDLYRERHRSFQRKVRALRDTDNDTVGIAGAALNGAAAHSG
jgi:xylulokinase